jgi:polygalacturonase
VGLRFKSNRGRGGIVENIFFSDIDMINIPTQAISFNMYYGGLSVSEMIAEGRNVEAKNKIVPPVSVETPLFRNITIRNLTCKGASQGLFLQGLPELNLENIILENIDIEADNGMACIDVNGISIKGMRLITKKLPVLRLKNSLNVEIEKLDIPNNRDSSIEIQGKKSKNITIRSINPREANMVLIGEGVDSKSIKVF